MNVILSIQFILRKPRKLILRFVFNCYITSVFVDVFAFFLMVDNVESNMESGILIKVNCYLVLTLTK